MYDIKNTIQELTRKHFNMQTIHHASREAATLKISFAIAGGWVWFWLTISMIFFFTVQDLYILVLAHYFLYTRNTYLPIP